ncbi:MAG: DNA topoisomerase IB [Actinomycetota bacterium]|nr:DNA topoisomerase IB [Actinomycetota bacterium]
MPRIRRVNCLHPGFSRRRRGRGFGYLDYSGEVIRDDAVLARIRALAIPPAWTDVWICADPYGHLQAVGTDAKGRRQYLYHEVWRQRRDREKFDRMVEFGTLLPKLRHHCDGALDVAGLDPTRVFAGAVGLVDLGLFRIGSPAYARDNGTFGLCTMERRHVRVSDGRARFAFPAKGGKKWIVEVDRPDLVRLLTDLKAKAGTGPRLLVARTPGGWRPVNPEDVNSFIKSAVGDEFSAKDFRTWNATVAAALALAIRDAGARRTVRTTNALVRQAMDEVATTLGNTPAVARRSYVDPRVVDRFVEGRTVRPSLDRLGQAPAIDLRIGPARAVVEGAVLDLLTDR